MVDWFAAAAEVFVYDGECGGVDYVAHAEVLAQGTYEGGFSGSHGAVEGYDAIVAQFSGKFCGGGIYVVYGFDLYFCHGVCVSVMICWVCICCMLLL